MTNGTSDTQQHASRDTKQPRHISAFLGGVNVPPEFQPDNRFERLWGALLVARWSDANNADTTVAAVVAQYPGAGLPYVQDSWRHWLRLSELMTGASLALMSVGHREEVEEFDFLIQIANARRSMAFACLSAGNSRTG